LAHKLVSQVVERLATDPVPAANRADGIAVDQMGTQQFVADLEVILCVEEIRRLLESRVADALGLGVEQARLPQILSFLGLGVAHDRNDTASWSYCQYE
jgi:hypothetical protein